MGLHARENSPRHPLPVNNELPSLKGRKILYTYGGYQPHEPVQSLEIFKPWMEKEGASVEAVNSLEPYADEAFMKEIDLVLQTFTM